MQRAAGEPERLRFQPRHAMARRHRIQRRSRHARWDVEHYFVLHETGLAERWQVEAVAQIGRAAILVALIGLVALLALPSRGWRVLPRRWQRDRIERRNDWRLV